MGNLPQVVSPAGAWSPTPSGGKTRAKQGKKEKQQETGRAEPLTHSSQPQRTPAHTRTHTPVEDENEPASYQFNT